MEGQACCLACRLRKDKTKADVLWLKPKSKGAMWSSKWVPFEVEVFTPKKSRVDRIPWRSEFLDTGCFVVSCPLLCMLCPEVAQGLPVSGSPGSICSDSDSELWMIHACQSCTKKLPCSSSCS